MINNGSFYSLDAGHGPSTSHHHKKAIFIITRRASYINNGK
jgi:hypothetical protein